MDMSKWKDAIVTVYYAWDRTGLNNMSVDKAIDNTTLENVMGLPGCKTF